VATLICRILSTSGVEAVVDRLCVDSEGLSAAAATLNERAGQVAGADEAGFVTGKASTNGAAGLCVSISTFCNDYGARLASHAHSAAAAAASYASVDDGGAADIGAVSL
jgi:hypothetical protein